MDGELQLFDNELSEDERLECMRRLHPALGAEGLDECICVVCDRFALRRDARRVEDTDWYYIDDVKAILSMENDNLPIGLVVQHRAPAYMERLHDVWVSPRGVNSYVDDFWGTACVV
ncbi:hypothetical protein PC129_g10134 [Phytophthora cactorum]|uniref:Uncharacterized protein n=1 Tax=Phytophthora cactorum TaxID=29920 RepID=A0A8T1I3K5_9STRA|nr:hypothetical protein PC111_g10541 [Phytophthora cactorum]KAG3013223.1 hypothetical protein PC119_g12590 [Phytophthora cactorum]KAG3133259.1 hypothetical protein C6341_g22605 [Phytophthora cactorum]KAG3219059.1 hypothetical protein PC129_g10134 [Phytophthora cactorum]KAG4236255.1 hypothetical protein PC116_g15647 [Phytophthora cactorum]